MTAAWARPAGQETASKVASSAVPPVTTWRTSPAAAVDAAARFGTRGSTSAGVPSTRSVTPSSSTSDSVTGPSKSNGRTASASANGTAERFSTSITTPSPPPSTVDRRTANARWTASPPGMRSVVSTTGAAATSRWRTAASSAGRCHRSSAPIHQSTPKPPGAGTT